MSDFTFCPGNTLRTATRYIVANRYRCEETLNLRRVRYLRDWRSDTLYLCITRFFTGSSRCVSIAIKGGDVAAYDMSQRSLVHLIAKQILIDKCKRQSARLNELERRSKDVSRMLRTTDFHTHKREDIDLPVNILKGIEQIQLNSKEFPSRNALHFVQENPLIHLESTFLLDQTNGLNFPDTIYKETVSYFPRRLDNNGNFYTTYSCFRFYDIDSDINTSILHSGRTRAC